MDITLTTAEWVTGINRRTLDRLNGEVGNTIDIEKIRHLLLVKDEDLNALVVQAEGGDPVLQVDLAVLLMQGKHYALAMYWLKKAARQENPEAMHLLAQCYLSEQGVGLDENTGLMWLHKAAAAGHVIAVEQTASLRSKFHGEKRRTSPRER